ncbi:unnamed protein product [Gongylonema pulchrum]|uniref:MSP domain-containing protein n=1 Tax=Gongylonema pulchrum TaxID=637853 RepID=A0A183D6F6_9BILA|nr:unnamed protein product [Gongylonema pulchrum]
MRTNYAPPPTWALRYCPRASEVYLHPVKKVVTTLRFAIDCKMVGSPALGPYISDGPRLVLVFSSNEKVSDGDGQIPLGFRAKIQFKTGEF